MKNIKSNKVSDRRLDISPMSEIESTEVSWLWKPYIPSSRITVLEGDPESGKTYAALAICAAVTRGWETPNEIPVEGASSDSPANVMYFSAEDNVGDTIRPRFIKMGGDETKFLAVNGLIQGNDGKEYQSGFRLSNINELESGFREYRPRLVVFDPLQAYLGAGVDAHRANEVRPILSELGKLAERCDCAILIIRHLNKSTQKALYRGSGSIDVTAAARSVLVAGKHPQDSDRFVIAHLKCSVARKGPALCYSISDGGLSWEGTADMSADDLLADPKQAARPRKSAATFLKEYLGDGAKPSAEVFAAAAKRGIAQRTVERAGEELAVIKQPSAYQGQWAWKLPKYEETVLSEKSSASLQEICQ